VFIACSAQVILKKNASVNFKSRKDEYLNFKVVFAYSLFLFSAFCGFVALRGIPLSWTGAFSVTEFVFIAILSRMFLHEKTSIKKLLGLSIIVVGIIVFAID